MSLPDGFSRSLWRAELERTATDAVLLSWSDTPGNLWGPVLDQVFGTSPRSLITGVVANGVGGGGGAVGRGCGGGVGGGAGVGCAGLGQGAAHGNGN